MCNFYHFTISSILEAYRQCPICWHWCPAIPRPSWSLGFMSDDRTNYVKNIGAFTLVVYEHQLHIIFNATKRWYLCQYRHAFIHETHTLAPEYAMAPGLAGIDYV